MNFTFKKLLEINHKVSFYHFSNKAAVKNCVKLRILLFHETHALGVKIELEKKTKLDAI